MIQRMLKWPPFHTGVFPAPTRSETSPSGPAFYAASFLSLAGELGVAVTVRNGG